MQQNYFLHDNLSLMRSPFIICTLLCEKSTRNLLRMRVKFLISKTFLPWGSTWAFPWWSMVYKRKVLNQTHRVYILFICLSVFNCFPDRSSKLHPFVTLQNQSVSVSWIYFERIKTQFFRWKLVPSRCGKIIHILVKIIPNLSNQWWLAPNFAARKR